MDLNQLAQEAKTAINNAPDVKKLEELKIEYLGRKRGKLTSILRSLAEKTLEEKKKIGKQANELKKEIESLLEQKLKEFQKTSSALKIDSTLPGKKVQLGHLHPLTQVERQIASIFAGMNFSIVEGPEVETEFYNFDALNIPADHPSRDMWDTLYIKKQPSPKGKWLMRTHTSPMQIHYMQTHQPPFQIIVPGRVFRREATDASHETNFYQFEGLMIGKDVSLANLKFILNEFFNKFFSRQSSPKTISSDKTKNKGDKNNVELRFRPSFFPFTEPSVEVDIKWRGSWLEVMGAGMVHPKVLEAGGYNPNNWQGFAFGGGIDRLAMIKYDINDIRLFYAGDLRFIHQF